ncbi:MAG: sterol desaturase family protein [Polyangiaceae bacterium]
MDAVQERARARLAWATVIDGVLPLALVAVGVLGSESPLTWLACLAVAFGGLCLVVLTAAGLFYALSLRTGARIQGERRKAPPMLREAAETARAMFVAATLAAWPLSLWRLGHPTAMVWDLTPTGTSPLQMVVMMGFGVVAMDAWLYWKHRLLHTRLLFGFHKAHHHFRDPTPFAGFAVAPVESLLTFWPILLLCIPQAVHWAPMYIALVVGFVVLNLYLHSGVTYGWVEATLPRVLLNTSAFHNVHHSHANVNFGEAMILWDKICKTRLEDARRRVSA